MRRTNAPILIVRGIPGSGKTTFARAFMDGLFHGNATFGGSTGIFETDNFFVNRGTGGYDFDKDLLSIAHNWNMAEVYRFCRDFPKAPCVVANTFASEGELHPYRNIARMTDRFLYIAGMHGSHPNVHNVPESAIQNIRSRWESMREDYSVYDDGEFGSVVEKCVSDFRKFIRIAGGKKFIKGDFPLDTEERLGV